MQHAERVETLCAPAVQTQDPKQLRFCFRGLLSFQGAPPYEQNADPLSDSACVASSKGREPTPGCVTGGERSASNPTAHVRFRSTKQLLASAKCWGKRVVYGWFGLCYERQLLGRMLP